MLRKFALFAVLTLLGTALHAQTALAQPALTRPADYKRLDRIAAADLMTHTSGLADQRFYDPDNKLRFKLEPGTRYAYSGEGINLLQFVIEQGLGLKVGDEMLTNSGVGARLFPPLLKAALGDVGMPWTWEYNPVLPVAAP